MLNTVPAFRAHPSGEDDISFPAGEDMIFGDVPVNIGNYYSSETGVFTCPAAVSTVFTITTGTSLML